MPVEGKDHPMEPGAPWWNGWEVGNDDVAAGNTIRADVGTSDGSKTHGMSLGAMSPFKNILLMNTAYTIQCSSSA